MDNIKPLKKIWCSFGIEEIFNIKLKDYTQLPLIHNIIFDGSLEWLKKEEKINKEYIKQYGSDNQTSEWENNLKELVQQANDLNLQLPKAYITLMQSADLRNCIRSSTTNSFNTNYNIVPIIDRPGEFLLMFWNDSQSSYYWFLHLVENKEPRIVMSTFFVSNHNGKSIYSPYSVQRCNERLEKMGEKDRTITDVNEILFECDNHFESFLYRLWIENEIWFNWFNNFEIKLLSPLQKEYIHSFKNYLSQEDLVALR